MKGGEKCWLGSSARLYLPECTRPQNQLDGLHLPDPDQQLPQFNEPGSKLSGVRTKFVACRAIFRRSLSHSSLRYLHGLTDDLPNGELPLGRILTLASHSHVPR